MIAVARRMTRTARAAVRGNVRARLAVANAAAWALIALGAALIAADWLP